MCNLLTLTEFKILQSNQDFLSIPSGLSADLTARIDGISCEDFSHCEAYDDARNSNVYAGSIEVAFLDEDGDESTARITAYRGFVVPEGTEDDSAYLDFSESVSEKYTVLVYYPGA